MSKKQLSMLIHAFRSVVISVLIDGKKNDRLYFPALNLHKLILTNGFPHEAILGCRSVHHIKLVGSSKEQMGQFRPQRVESVIAAKTRRGRSGVGETWGIIQDMYSFPYALLSIFTPSLSLPPVSKLYVREHSNTTYPSMLLRDHRSKC